MRRTLCMIFYCFVLAANGAEIKPSKQHSVFSAVVQDTAIAITLECQPFDSRRHKVTSLVVDENGNSRPATIDGRVVVGMDGTLPRAGAPQLSKLVVRFGKKRVEVPERLLTHVFYPHWGLATFDHRFGDTIISVSADGSAVLVSLGVGDGGGTGTYSLYIGSDGTCTDKEPGRPEP